MADERRDVGETGGTEWRDGPADASSTDQREQPSALGGDVATRSSTRRTPPDERADAGDKR